MFTLEENKELGLFLQARMGSTRLPGKVMMKIGGKSVLALMTERIKQTKYGEHLFLLTSSRPIDDVIEQFALAEHISCFRGSEIDVLDRFVQAAKHWHVKYILRLTADSPFFSQKALVDTVDGYFRRQKPDYYFIDGYPIGIGSVEMMSTAALQRALQETIPGQTYFREHVMTYLTTHPELFRVVIEKTALRYQNERIRLALDEENDLRLLRIVFDKLNGDLDTDHIFELFENEPELAEINEDVIQKKM